MIQHISIIDPVALDKRLKSIEEALQELISQKKAIPKNEWLTLEEFKSATGIKSHYYINKMRLVGKERKSEFKEQILGKKLYIHESEVDKYFNGAYS